MERKRIHLSLAERQEIYVMRERRKGFREIARWLKRPASTVLREVRRNTPRHPISGNVTALEKAKEAQERAKRRQREKVTQRGSALERRPDVARRAEALLLETKYSPEDIAGILSRSDLGVRLSGKSIRRWIAKHRSSYQQHFPHRGKRRRKHLTPRNERKRAKEAAPAKRSIHERPALIGERTRLGDFELDMIVCRQSKSAILSVVDRLSSKLWLRKVENLRAETVRQEIIRVLHGIPPQFIRSCTFDRGSEFAEVSQLEVIFDLTNYFCDAYCAWQKGSVEHGNKRVRRFFPKGTDLSTVSEKALAQVERILNARPFQKHRGLAPDDVWFIELNNAQRFLH